MTYTAKTHPGQKYSHNEDYFLLPEPGESKKRLPTGRLGHLFLLCDGMGGGNAGEVASQMACRWIFDAFYTSRKPVPSDIIINTNRRLYALSKDYAEYQGMGTTLVAGLFRKKEAVFYTVGDSRVYRLRAGTLEQLSEDQSEVWELYKLGQISKDDIRTHPRNNIITRAMGVDPVMKPEHINRCKSDLQKGDRFLLCSDGLSDMLADSEIAVIMNKNMSPEDTAHELVRGANENGGRDNITVVIIEI